VTSRDSHARCRDPIFACLFLIQVSILGYFAFAKGTQRLRVELSGSDDAFFEWAHGGSAGQFIMCFIGTACFGAVLCLFWVYSTIEDSDMVLRISFKVWMAIYLAGSLLSIFMGSIGMCITCLLGFFVTYCLLRAAHNKLAFASANLSIASSALQANRSPLCVVATSMLVSVAWTLFWSLGVLGMADALPRQTMNGIFFMLLVSFFWGCGVISNVAHVTVSGAVASWWFRSPTNQDKAVVRRALWRASTSSFGSICYGSLLVAIINSTRSLVRLLRGQSGIAYAHCSCLTFRVHEQLSTVRSKGGRVLAYCVNCILFYAEAWARYINRYAFTCSFTASIWISKSLTC